MDEADRAQIVIDAELDGVIAAARGIKPAPRQWCVDCDELLLAHRRAYGRCIHCQTALENRIRREACGV